MQLIITAMLLALPLPLLAQDAAQIEAYRHAQFKLNQHVLADGGTGRGGTHLHFGVDPAPIEPGDHLLVCGQERTVESLVEGGVVVTEELSSDCPAGSLIPVLRYPDEQSIWDAAIQAKRAEIQELHPSEEVKAQIAIKEAADTEIKRLREQSRETVKGKGK